MHICAHARNIQCVHMDTCGGAASPRCYSQNLAVALTVVFCSFLPASCGLLPSNGAMADHQVAMMEPCSAV